MATSKRVMKIRCPHIPLREIIEATNNFDEDNVIGQGGEGKVYKAKLGNVSVAVKHLKPNCPQFMEEIALYSILRHDNVVSLLGHCQQSGQKILVYGLMHNGSLADNLYNKRRDDQFLVLPWEVRLKVCIGAARGLSYLHYGICELPQGVIHRDVKPANILLDENWNAKIADLGMLKKSHPDQRSNSAFSASVRGTSGYYAPEYLLFQKITRAIDVYSFGVVLFEVLCKKSPWDRGYSNYGNEHEELGLWAQQNVDLDLNGAISKNCLKAFTNLIQECLEKDPAKRPRMDDVVKALEHVLRLQEHDIKFANNFHKVAPPPTPPPPPPPSLRPTYKPAAAHNFHPATHNDITNAKVSATSGMFYLNGTEDRIVLYYTSLGVYKKVAADCQEVRLIFKLLGVLVDERDVCLDESFKKEFMGMFKGTGLSLPRLFIRGKHIGGAAEIVQHHAEGKLEELIEGFPRRESGWSCKNCWDKRFVACPKVDCGDCNEQGLIRCPSCCSWMLSTGN